jgi:hypothetical protein
MNPTPEFNRNTSVKINQPFYTEGAIYSFRKEISSGLERSVSSRMKRTPMVTISALACTSSTDRGFA